MSKRTTVAPEGRPVPGKPAIVSDEEWLARWSKHIHDLASSFRRTYRLVTEDQECLSQELAIKCLSLGQQYRTPRHTQFTKTCLNNFARDRWRKLKLHQRRYLEMLPADERRPAPDALSAIHADLAADRMLASLTPLQEKLIVAYTGLDGPSIVDHRKLAKLTGLSVTQVAAEIDTALQAMQAVVEVAA